ncbi:carboxylating nicotinate-nucleotide diphosphorylase [Candidatus Woesearchaeota archaeon]|nr:carboxylating nicotinate-nucleotide diphosphorylase [Candidatus Woesearchaeota archaeon]
MDIRKHKQLVKAALEEDIGIGDVTSRFTIPDDLKAKGVIIAKEPGIISGLALTKLAFQLVDPAFTFCSSISDGDRVKKGQPVMMVEGFAQPMLTAERTALNFLSRLSGISTLTGLYVDKVIHTKTKIMDTRKTTPGWRELEKYAVRMGGGTNHRMGLYDMALVKDNHIIARRGILNAVACLPKDVETEIEIESLEQLEEALSSRADWIMLDNMPAEDMKKAVKLIAGKKIVEASGGVSLENVRSIAETGIDFVSVGALTHSAKALDLSMKISLE